MAQVKLPVLRCPSDTFLGTSPYSSIYVWHDFCHDTGVEGAQCDPNGDSAWWGAWATFTEYNLASTSYLGVAGVGGTLENKWKRWAGMFGGWTKTPAAAIRDGLGNTLAFGESTGSDEYNYAWITAGTMDTWYGLGDSFIQFGSPHTGGTHFAFADGSVRFVAANVNLGILQALSGIADQVPAELP